jgi:transposase
VALLEGATAHGFATPPWTLKRVRLLIEREFGVRYSEVHVWRLLGQLGFSNLVRDYVASTAGQIQLHFLPGYAPELNPVEFLWGWLKRHALANFCPDTFAELHRTTRGKLKSAQRRSLIIASCWQQAELF